MTFIIHHVQRLEISLNTDGLPLFKSSSNTLWPVLCAIVNLEPIRVFPVVLTYGKTKPTDLKFLDELISELKLLMQDGLSDGDRLYEVTVRAIVCDAPARAMVKATKLCSGYSGCDKCNQHGSFRCVISESRKL